MQTKLVNDKNVFTQKQNYTDYQNKISNLLRDQHTRGAGKYTNGGFVNFSYTYDLTWHYDATTDKVIVTNAMINFTRNPPKYINGGTDSGYWDTIAFAVPNAPLPHEEGIGIGDLPGVNGDSLWNDFRGSNYGILAFFSQNNKTEQYTIKYGNVTPYSVGRNPDGTFTLMVSEDRINAYGSDGTIYPDGSSHRPNDDGIHVQPAWLHGDVKVNVTVPAKPQQKIHYHYDVSQKTS